MLGSKTDDSLQYLTKYKSRESESATYIDDTPFILHCHSILSAHQLDWNRSSGRAALYLYRHRAHLLMKLELWYNIRYKLAPSVKRGWETLGEVYCKFNASRNLQLPYLCPGVGGCSLPD